MKTMEQLEQEFEQAKAELQAQQADNDELRALGLPEPDSRHAFRDMPCLVYKLGSAYSSLGEPAKPEDGLALLRKFEPYLVDIDARQRGCLSIAPPEAQSDHYPEDSVRWHIEDAVCLELHGCPGKFSTMELRAWVRLPKGGLRQLTVGIAPAPHWVRSRVSYTREGSPSHNCSHELAQFTKELERVKWGSGSADCYHYTIVFGGVPTELELC